MRKWSTVRKYIASFVSICMLLTYVQPITMAIAADKQPPEIIGLSNTEVQEDGSITVEFTVQDDYTSPGSIAVTAASDNSDIIDDPTPVNDNGSVSMTLSPKENQNGDVDITVTAEDEDAQITRQTITLTVNAENDAPVAENVSKGGIINSEGTPVEITFDASDIDGDALTYSIVDQSDLTDKGTLSQIDNNKVVFTPNADFSGTATFTYKANDSQTDSNVATATIEIVALNSIPTADDSSVTTDEDNAVEITLKGSDADADALTYSIVDGSALEGKGTLSEINGNKVTFTPNANWSGQTSFSFKVNDGIMDSATKTVTIDVNAVNDEPVATGDSVSTDEDQPIEITLNATDIDGDTLTYSIVDGSALEGKGTLLEIDGNKVTFTPNANWHGQTSFTFKANDGQADSNTVTVTVTVDSVNDSPVTTNNTVSVDEDNSIEITLNATDAESDSLTYSIVDQSDLTDKGTLSEITGNKLTFTPDENWNGQTSFTFKANDGNSDSNISTVTIDVNAVNDAPVATGDSVSTDEDNSIEITLNATDIDADALTYSIVDGSDLEGKGTLSEIDGNKVTFTPNANWHGQTSFTFKANDGQADSNTVTVTITVNSVNDSPFTTNNTVSVDEDNSLEITLNATDPEDDALTYSIVDGSDLEGKGTLSEVNGNKVTFTPNANWNGQTSFTFKANDGNSDSNVSTVTINVNSVNDVPVSVDNAVGADEDQPIEITLNATDIDADTLTYSIVDGSDLEGKGTLSEITGNKVTFTPNANWHGQTSFTFKANDGSADSNISTVTITIDPLNDDPTAVNDTPNVDEDGTVLIDVLANDLDPDLITDPDTEVLIISNVGDASHGTAVLEDGKIRYTPVANYNGQDSFTYTIQDLVGVVSTSTVTVTVNSVNDAPVSTGDSVSTDEDQPIEITLSAADIENSTLTYSVVDDSDLSGKGILSAIEGNKVTFTPDANWNGETSFTFKANDGEDDSDVSTITITVNPINDAPTAVNDTVNINEDNEALIDVLANDTDIDLTTNSDIESLTIVSTTTPAHGSAVIEDNKIRYAPAANYNGTDTFTYTMKDSEGVTSTATVNINIAAVNDPPEFSNLEDTYTINEDGTATIYFNISDVECDVSSLMLQYATLNDTLLPKSNITLTGMGDSETQKTLTLRPVANKYGSAQIKLFLCDGMLVTTKMITLVVNPVNDAPVAKNDTISFTEDTPIEIDMDTLIANDTDIEGDTLSFDSYLGDISEGTLTLIEGNRYLYTPPTNFDGEATFHYKVSDGSDLTGTGTVTLKAIADNDAPTITLEDGYSTSTDEDIVSAPINFTISDIETAAKDLVLTVGCDNEDLIQDGNLGITKNDDGTCTLVVTPNADQHGTCNITIEASDGEKIVTKTIEYTINSIEDAPYAEDDSITMQAETTQTIDLLKNDYDRDNDVLTIISINGTSITEGTPMDIGDAYVTLNADGTITYMPNEGEEGIKTFTYAVSDNCAFGCAPATATVTVIINGVNDPPLLDPIADVKFDEDTSGTASFNVTDKDIGDTQSYTVSSSDQSIIKDEDITVNADNTISIVPQENANGTVTITLTVEDSGGLTDTASFEVLVRPINDEPVMNPALSNIEVTEDIPQIIDILEGATDIENDTISVVSVSGASYGNIQKVSNGKYRYTPSENYNGSDTITYAVTDGHCIITGTINIDVTAVDDVPVAVSDYVTYQSGDTLTISALNNDYDYDTPYGDSISINSFTQPTYGTVTQSGNTFIYTPGAYTSADASDNYDTFTYTIKDSDGSVSNTATVYIARKDYNDTFTPVVGNIYDTITEDDPAKDYTIYIFDPDTEQDGFTIEANTDPTKGTASYNSATRTLTYTPNADAYGTDTFSFKVTDSRGITAYGNVTIYITPVNDAPTVTSVDTQNIQEDSETGDIVVTLSDPDNALSDLMFSVFSASETLLPNNSFSVNYDPDTGLATINIHPFKDESGSATINMLVSDGLLSTMKQFILNVEPVNDAPRAFDYTVDTNEEVPITFSVKTDTTDVDNVVDDIQVIITAQPDTNAGTAVINADGTIKFTPKKDYFGTTTLKYQLYDGESYSEEKTVTLNVANVNDEPVISGIKYVQTTNEDTDKSVSFNLYDADGDTLQISAVSSNTSLVANDDVQITGTGDTRTITMHPALNDSGVTYITVTAFDGTATVNYEFELTVVAVNDLPTAEDTSATTDEDTKVTIDIKPYISDVEDTDANLYVVNLSTPSNGKVVSNGDGTISYTPNKNYNGPDSFTYTISDTSNATDTGTIAITVNPVNDPPIVATDRRTTDEDVAIDSIDVLANDSDVENDTLTVVSYGTPAKGDIEILSNGVIKYTPHTDANGTDQFSYTVSDGEDTSTGQVIIYITPIDDPPEYEPVSDMTGGESGGAFEFDEDTVGVFEINISDAETAVSNLIITVESLDESLVKTSNITFSGSGIEKTIKMTPEKNKFGSFKLRVTTSDGINTTVVDYDIVINSVNDAPVLGDYSKTIEEEGTATGSVMATDIETDPADITFSLGGDPSHGTAVVNSDGTWTYTPNEDWNGTDTFIITANDNDPEGALTDDGTITITVTPVNDLPTAVDDTASTDEHTEKVINVLENDLDPDLNDTPLVEDITIVSVTQPDHGKVTISDDKKTVTYTPNENWDGSNYTDASYHWNGETSFTYVMKDKDGNESQATVNVTVNPVNDEPAPVDDTATTNEDNAVTIDVLANDIDVDFSDEGSTETKELVSVTQPSNGTSEIVSGKVKYTPNANWYGTDTFEYTMKDSGGVERTAEVTVTVNSVNDAPIISGITGPITINEDTDTGALTFNVSDIEDAAGALTVSLSSTNTDLIDSSCAVYGGADGDRTITLTPKADQNGTATITLTVIDSGNLTHTMSFVVNVDPINDAPIANDDTATTNEDNAVTIDVLANDTDVDFSDEGSTETKTIDSITQPTNGTTEIVSGKVKYTPNANWFGEDTFEYTMKDSGGVERTAEVTVTVNSVNDAPIISGITGPITINEDTDTGALTFSVSDIEDAAGTLTVSLSSTNTDLIDSSCAVYGGADGNRTITITPKADQNGTATITLTVIDSGNLTDTMSFVVNVNAVNDVPVANDDTATTNEDNAVTIDVLANDTDVDFSDEGSTETKTIVSITQPSNGTTEIVSGKVKYTPNANWFGEDTFEYTMKDSAGVEKTATVTVTVNSVNDAPVAVADTATTNEDTLVDISVISNDTDIDLSNVPNIEDLTVKSIDMTGSHGTAVIKDGSNGKVISYTPNANYNGTDTFKYTVKDVDGATSTTTVTVTVNAVNDDPVANDDTVTTNEDNAVTIDVLANDTDIDFDDVDSTETKTIVSITQPSNGMTEIVSGKVKYTPNANWYGTDTFEYTMKDSGGVERTATVTITVNSVNDAPTISGITGPITIDEDKDTGALTFNISDIEEAAEILTVTADSSNTDLIDGSCIALAGSGTDRTIIITPKENKNGTATITLTVKDSGNLTDTMSFVVNVNAVNDAPVANNDTATTDEDNAVTIDVLANDTDVDFGDVDSTETKTIVSITQPSNGTTEIVSGKVKYTPNANWNGTDTFEYTMKDSGGVEKTATVTVTVKAVNDAPIANDDTATTDEDNAVTIDVLANDTDVDFSDEGSTETKTIASITQPSNGTTEIVSGKVKYTPNANWFGTNTFTYKVKDSAGVEKTATVTVTVKPINDAPIISSIAGPITINEDANTGALTFSVSDIEDAAGTLVVTAQSDNEDLIDSSCIVFGGADGNRTITITPKANQNGTATITLTVKDSGDLTDTMSFVVNVNAVNDAPIANDDTATTNEDNEVVIDVLANDTDVDFDDKDSTETKELVSVTQPANGMTTIEGGKVKYVPNASYNGTDTFTYTMKDSGGVERTATVTVTVNAVNDPPTISGIEGPITIDEDTDTGALTFNVSDIEDALGTLVVTAKSDNEDLIDESCIVFGGADGDRTITITPKADQNGTATITLTVKDSGDLTDTMSFIVNVNAVNDHPIANDDEITTDEDNEVIIDVLANDTDVDFYDKDSTETKTIVSVTQPSNGTVTIEDGKVRYTPNENWYGTDTFEYTMKDSFGVEKTAKVTVTVNSVNDAPSISGIDGDVTIKENEQTDELSFNISDIEDDASILSLKIESSNTKLVDSSCVTFKGTGNDRTIVIKPKAGAYGKAEITIIVTDSNGETASMTFIINVQEVADNIPKTGENYPIMYYVIGLLLLAAGVTILLKRKRKEKTK